MRSLPSMTSGRRPCCCRSHAAYSPEIPAPITSTSACSARLPQRASAGATAAAARALVTVRREILVSQVTCHPHAKERIERRFRIAPPEAGALAAGPRDPAAAAGDAPLAGRAGGCLDGALVDGRRGVRRLVAVGGPLP